MLRVELGDISTATCRNGGKKVPDDERPDQQADEAQEAKEVKEAELEDLDVSEIDTKDVKGGAHAYGQAYLGA